METREVSQKIERTRSKNISRVDVITKKIQTRNVRPQSPISIISLLPLLLPPESIKNVFSFWKSSRRLLFHDFHESFLALVCSSCCVLFVGSCGCHQSSTIRALQLILIFLIIFFFYIHRSSLPSSTSSSSSWIIARKYYRRREEDK